MLSVPTGFPLNPKSFLFRTQGHTSSGCCLPSLPFSTAGPCLPTLPHTWQAGSCSMALHWLNVSHTLYICCTDQNLSSMALRCVSCSSFYSQDLIYAQESRSSINIWCHWFGHSFSFCLLDNPIRLLLTYLTLDLCQFNDFFHYKFVLFLVSLCTFSVTQIWRSFQILLSLTQLHLIDLTTSVTSTYKTFLKFVPYSSFHHQCFSSDLHCFHWDYCQ